MDSTRRARAGKPGHRGWGWIRKLPSGRFQASYLHNGARHTAPTTFTQRTTAEGWLAQERRAIEHDAIGGQPWTPPKARTAAAKAAAVSLSDYAAQWITEHPCKERTRHEYRLLFAQLIEPKLGAVPLRELTPAMVRSWHAGLARRKTLSRNATATILLRAICKTAHNDGLIGSNPVADLKRLSKPAAQVEPKVLTPAEITKLADAMPARLVALVLIAAWTGLRWGELSELRRKDIGPDCDVIHLSRAVNHHGGCHIDTPKSGKGRNVAVPPHIRDDLRAHLEHHVGSSPDALLFPSTSSATRCGHLFDSTFRRAAWLPALAAVGLSGVRVHDLRHTAGTLAVAAGANLKESIARLGHSSAAASLTHQAVVAGRDAEIAEALSMLATKPKLAVVVSEKSSESSLSSV